HGVQRGCKLWIHGRGAPLLSLDRRSGAVERAFGQCPGGGVVVFERWRDGETTACERLEVRYSAGGRNWSAGRASGVAVGDEAAGGAQVVKATSDARLSGNCEKTGADRGDRWFCGRRVTGCGADQFAGRSHRGGEPGRTCGYDQVEIGGREDREHRVGGPVRRGL